METRSAGEGVGRRPKGKGRPPPSGGIFLWTGVEAPYAWDEIVRYSHLRESCIDGLASVHGALVSSTENINNLKTHEPLARDSEIPSY